MENIFDAVETSPDLEREGVEMTMVTERLTLARAGGANNAFKRAIDKLRRDRQATMTFLSGDEDRALTQEVFVDHCVKKWETKAHNDDGAFVEGICNPKGKEPLPVTRENILMMFRRLPALYDQAFITANSGQSYLLKHIEAIKGN